MLFRDLDLPGWPCMATVGCILASEQLLRLQHTPGIEGIGRRRWGCVRKCRKLIWSGRVTESWPRAPVLGQFGVVVGHSWRAKYRNFSQAPKDSGKRRKALSFIIAQVW